MTTTQAEPELGRRYTVMLLVVILDDPWSASLIYSTLDDTNTRVRAAWPLAPVLELPTTNVTATLSADTETSTADAQATWSLTEDQVNALAPHNGDSYRISVDGETWVSGSIECLP